MTTQFAILPLALLFVVIVAGVIIAVLASGGSRKGR